MAWHWQATMALPSRSNEKSKHTGDNANCWNCALTGLPKKHYHWRCRDSSKRDSQRIGKHEQAFVWQACNNSWMLPYRFSLTPRHKSVIPLPEPKSSLHSCKTAIQGEPKLPILCTAILENLKHGGSHESCFRVILGSVVSLAFQMFLENKKKLEID